MPVELHILEVLWSLLVGSILDNQLSTTCMGNRIRNTAKQFTFNFGEKPWIAKGDHTLFKRYIDQYNKWRDGALTAAADIAENDNNCAILSLDFKSFFYSISVDWDEVLDTVRINEKNYKKIAFAEKLTEILRDIYTTYQKKISENLNLSHPKTNNKNVIPIGLSSSPIISNWHLRKFDQQIIKELRPVYYSRYVDDILFVFKDPAINENSINPVESFFKEYFIDIFEPLKEQEQIVYRLRTNPDIKIQNEKIILHFFDKSHTLAGLEVYKTELEKNSSAFRFLPGDDVEQKLEDLAYDVLYEGSKHRFRSVVGLAENEAELSKFLSTQIIAHRMCEVKGDDLAFDQLFKFFNGLNGLRFFRMWEKVFVYSIVKNSKEFYVKFFKAISNLIDKIIYNFDISRIHDFELQSIEIKEELRNSLKSYIEISASMASALLNQKNIPLFIDEIVSYGFEDSPIQISNISRVIRQTNMMRHQYVSWPLINYSNYAGDLSEKPIVSTPTTLQLDKEKCLLSPRYIHFDEWQCFKTLSKMTTSVDADPFFGFMENTLNGYTKTLDRDLPSIKLEKENDSNKRPISWRCKIGEKQELANGEFKLAIANVKIPVSYIIRSIHKDEVPNETLERQKSLFEILNKANQLGVSLVVLPEVSVPVRWLPFMVNYARRHQIGLIFGLEHWTSPNNRVFNFLIEVLPFQQSEDYRSCVLNIRNKNHYSPAEKLEITRVGLIPGEPVPADMQYYLHQWSGISFASYNCFELADIEHRSIFRSNLDLLVAAVWNKDTAYYKNILEACSRDLFCFVVQANTSQFGGSCVLQPASSYDLNIINVKGGENSCVLSTSLKIAEMRKAQYEIIRRPDSIFKPTPPGYDHGSVLKRS